MVSSLRTSSPVLRWLSRNESSSRSGAGSARFSARGLAAFCTPRAAWISSMRLHRSTMHCGSAIFSRGQCSRTREASSGAAKTVPAANRDAALSCLVLLDRADIQRRDDLGDFLLDEARGDRRAVVMQHGDERGRVDAGVVDEQRLQLCVAVLLHHEHLGVRLHEVEDLVLEREGADAQRVDEDVLLRERLESLVHRGTGTSIKDHPEPGWLLG